jgi:hypothetical protein
VTSDAVTPDAVTPDAVTSDTTIPDTTIPGAVIPGAMSRLHRDGYLVLPGLLPAHHRRRIRAQLAPLLMPAGFKGRMANSLLRDRPALRRRLSANARRVQRSQATLRSFIDSSKLPSPP